MDLSVVVPTFQRRSSVERLLRALLGQTLSPARFEVIVSIDGSDDGTRESVENHRAPFSLHAIWNAHRGRAGACNAGIRIGRGKIIVILDDDMLPAPDCLQAHVAAHGPDLKSRRIVFGAAPIRVTATSPRLSRYIARKFDDHFLRLARPGHRLTVRDFYSGNMSAPRELLLDIGLFDESFREYGNEDLELATRCRRAGVDVVYSSTAEAEQCYEKTFRQLARDTIAKGKTAVAFANKHPDIAAELQLSQFHAESWRWRLARNTLLAVTHVAPRVVGSVTALGDVIERLPVRNTDPYYRFVLDYFYWVGARAARQADDPAGAHSLDGETK